MHYNADYCLPSSTAGSLNRKTESPSKHFTACSPAQKFLQTELLKELQCSILPAVKHSNFFKQKY
jgi:hypothetical protein